MVLTIVTVRVDQLGEVLVARGDQRAHALLAGLCRERGDDVVGLHALDLEQRPAHGADALVQRRDLRRRDRRASAGGWPCTRRRGRRGRSFLWRRIRTRYNPRLVLVQAAQHVEHAVDGAGRLARPCCAGRAARGTRDTGRTTRRPGAGFSWRADRGAGGEFQVPAGAKYAPARWADGGHPAHAAARPRRAATNHDITDHEPWREDPELLAPELIEKPWSGREAWRVFAIIAEFAEATERLNGVRPRGQHLRQRAHRARPSPTTSSPRRSRGSCRMPASPSSPAAAPG